MTRWRRAVRTALVALLALLGLTAPAAQASINFGNETIPDLSFGMVGTDGTCATFNTQVTLPHASGHTGNLAYSLSPAPPAGLTFTTVSGQSYAATISGNPTAAAAQASYTYTATDDSDNSTATLTFTLEVVDERDALEAFYTATGGANWTTKTNWSANISPTACLDDLAGVTTNADGRVSEIILRDNNLTGSLPGKLGDLTALTTLALSGNTLSGALPTELGNLINLQGLDLRSNQLSGALPTQLGNLTNLTYLNIAHNELSGTLPTWLGNLSNLTHIHLHTNQLSGMIPPALGNLSNLEELFLYDNQFSGMIPPALGNLAKLEQLWLHNNELSGTIPSELGNLTNLRDLRFHRNQLSGTIPPELGNLTNLRDLRFHRNQLSGTIPPELGNLTNLLLLHLDTNQLSGTIPPELGNLSNLEHLWLDHNQLSGTIPSELGNLSNLKYLVLRNNQLSGTIPSELGNLTELVYLVLRNNQLSGTIPSELGNLTELVYLWLRDNQLSGTIPSTWGTASHPLSALERLYLNGNQLSGPLPPALGNLTKLKYLWLYNNQLSGTIPSTWGTASHPLSELAQLYLADNSLCLPASRKTWYETLSTDPLFLCSVPSAQLYTRNEAIPVLSLTGGGATPTLTSSPALPSGLAFNTGAYAMQGTPTAVHRSQVHRITVADAYSSVTHPIELTVVAQQAVTVAAWGQPSDSDITLVTAETPPPLAGAGPRMRVIMKTSGGQEIPKDVQYNPPASLCLPVPATLSLSSAALYRYTGSSWQRESAGHKTTTAGEVCADVADLSHSVFTVGPYSTVTGGDGSGGGGGGGVARDRHGDTPATATAVSVERRQTARRGTRTAGQINTRTDVDYFQLSVPQAGWLVLETTGSTNTHGTLWEAEALLNETSALQTGGLHRLTQAASHVTPLAQDDDSGTRQNFRIPLRVPAGDYLLAITGTGSSVGTYTLRSTLVAGWLDNPQPASHQSGISVLSGWLCTADSVVFEVNDTVELEATYGTGRLDTADQCDETDTGFGLLFNWNRLGDGEHTVTLVVDDIALETFPITVTTLGEEFRTGLSGSATLTDFPTEGETARLVWQEALQNFALASGQGGGSGTHRDPDQAVLENPQPGSYQSGVSVLSGWACEAETVVLEIDGTWRLAAGYGTERTDTIGKCEDMDNGFGVLFNWNLLGDGEHTVRLLIDGEEWATATFTVTTLGEEFRRGLTRTEPIVDFPGPGETVTVEWQQAQQNFVITDWQRGDDPSP